MKTICLLPILCLFLFPATSYGQTTWQPYACHISFKIKNAGFTVNGTFDTASATLMFSPDKLTTSSLSGTVIVNSIQTGINKRDKDIKKQEYFNVDQFKEITIKSTKLYYKGANYAGLFDITIKGITKQVEIPFNFEPLSNEATFKGELTINRRDFGVGRHSMIMSDNVTADIEIKAKK